MADAIDDGFVRSVGSADAGAAAVSLLIHPEDVFQPGRLEPLDRLLDEGEFTDGQREAAAALLAFKQREGLSRFNAGAPVALCDQKRARVLIAGPWRDGRLLDQAAPRQTWQAVCDAARGDNPDADLHVLAEAGSPLADCDLRGGSVLSGDPDLIDLIAQVDAVYTFGGLVGWEAALAGKRPVCFGRPFYAGRGLTDDRAPGGARRPRSLVDLFAASLAVSRFIDPFDGAPCEPQVAYSRLAAFKRHARRTAGDWTGLNIPPAKARVLAAFFNGPTARFRVAEKPAPGGRALAWASRPNSAVKEAVARDPGAVSFVEDGFLRSAGLGASFHPAASLALDHGGIYYDPGSTSDLAGILAKGNFTAAELADAAALRARIVALGLSKYNLQGAALDLPGGGGQRRILVPGQVENDASVLRGGAGLTNGQLLERVRSAHPDAVILYKEHPDVAAGIRPGAIGAAAGLADRVISDGDIIACIEWADEVHTLTSLTGFEALLREKPVTTHGWPFYAGYGLTRDLGPPPVPARRPITLDQLVAGALIAYPLYLDPISWLPCDALTFVERLKRAASQRNLAAERLTAHPWLRGLNALKLMLRPPRPPAY